MAIEPDTGLFTAGELTEACGDDNHEAVVGLALLDDDPAHDDATDRRRAAFEVLGDSAYGTGDARAALDEAGHTAVIKPMPLRPAVAGGFTLDDFTVDETAGTVTCPNGVTRPITAARTVTFGVACRDCPLRQRCTTAKDRPQPAACTNTTPCCAKPATTGPPTPTCATPTAGTGPWSNAPSPGSSARKAAAANCATAAWPPTTGGYTPAWPPSTCAACSTSAYPPRRHLGTGLTPPPPRTPPIDGHRQTSVVQHHAVTRPPHRRADSATFPITTAAPRPQKRD